MNQEKITQLKNKQRNMARKNTDIYREVILTMLQGEVPGVALGKDFFEYFSSDYVTSTWVQLKALAANIHKRPLGMGIGASPMHSNMGESSYLNKKAAKMMMETNPIAEVDEISERSYMANQSNTENDL